MPWSYSGNWAVICGFPGLAGPQWLVSVLSRAVATTPDQACAGRFTLAEARRLAQAATRLGYTTRLRHLARRGAEPGA